MKDGEIVEHAGTEEIYSEPKHPYTRALLASIPRMRLALRTCASACAACRRGRAPCLFAVRRHQVSRRLPAFRMGEPGRAQGRRHRAGAAAAHHQLRQVQPVHPEGHFTAGAGRARVRDACSPARWTSRPRRTDLLAEDVAVAADGLSVTFRLNPAARFQNGTPVTGRGREAQLRHADEQAGGAAVPRGVRRRAAGGGHRRAHRALRFQARQRRAAADGRRPAGVQPRLGRRQALRPGGDGHADRQRPVQDRPPQLRPRHHLRARSELLGARPERAPRHATTSTASPTRSTRTPPRRPRPSRRASSITSQVFSARDWARTYVGQEIRLGRAHQGASCRRRTPATSRASSSTCGARSSRIRACARRSGSLSISSG